MSKNSIIIISIASVLMAITFFVLVEIPHSSADISDWETYTSDKYGFEFKYPKGSQIEYYEDSEGVCISQFGVSVREASGYNKNGRWAGVILVGGGIANVYKSIGEGGTFEDIALEKDGLVYTIYTCRARNHEKVRRDILKTFRIR